MSKFALLIALILVSLVNTVSAQSGIYVASGAKIYFAGDSATMFSNLTNKGNIGVAKSAVVNFKGKTWENDSKATITDESANGVSGKGGVIRFIDTVRQNIAGGYNAATNYLRGKIGDSIQNAIKPEIANVLTEYKLPQTASDLAGKDIPILGKQKLNIDFTSLLSKLVADKMFKEIEAQEYKIRTDVAARTTPLLQQVFSSSKAFHQ